MLRRLQLAQTRRYLGTVVRKAPSVRSTVGVTTSGTPSGSTNTSSDNNAWLNNSSETTLSKKKLLGETLGGFTLETNSPVSYTSVSSSDVDWSVSFRGLGSSPFEEKVQAELSKPLSSDDIEVKPDGLVYLPEIKYRRILNKAFGAGGWGLVPRSDTIVTAKLVTREYALICHGQLVSISRGEQDYFNESGIPTATEGCKSNALMRCCKDLGIGSELWDPVFIKEFKKANCVEKFVEHVTTKKKKKIWLKKGREVEYPYK